MMKKLLMLMLVLGLVATTANATISLRIVTKTAEGVAPSATQYIEPVDSQVTLNPSDYAWIGIYNDTDYSLLPGGVTGQDIVYVSIDSGTAGSGSWVMVEGAPVYTYYTPQMPAPTPPNAYYGNTNYGPYDNLVHPGEFMEYGLTYTQATLVGLGIGVLDAKEFHCDSAGDVVIRLWANDTVTELGNFVIHQVAIPEPMTITLLGLGGLLLKRRK